MRRILVSGLIACLLIGMILFLFKLIVLDTLDPLFRPLILLLTGREYLVLPLSLAITFIIVLAVGSIATRMRIQQFYNSRIRKVPKDLQAGCGALVSIGTDSYFIAVIIKEISFQRIDGHIEQYYVLYAPSVPIPWSGMPVIYVQKEKVIPLKLSYREIYTITGSFGRNTPDLIGEMAQNACQSDISGE